MCTRSILGKIKDDVPGVFNSEKCGKEEGVCAAALPRDLLCDGVLDLQPGVDLHEVVLPALGLVEELNGAGVGVSGAPAEVDGVPQHGLADVVRQLGRRRKLNHLLVAALNGAVALVEVDDVALGKWKKLATIKGIVFRCKTKPSWQEEIDSDSIKYTLLCKGEMFI